MPCEIVTVCGRYTFATAIVTVAAGEPQARRFRDRVAAGVLHRRLEVVGYRPFL